jgi:hypothetical protein
MLLKSSAYVGQAFSLRRVFNPPAGACTNPTDADSSGRDTFVRHLGRLHRSEGRLKIGRRLKACPTKELLPWM